MNAESAAGNGPRSSGRQRAAPTSLAQAWTMSSDEGTSSTSSKCWLQFPTKAAAEPGVFDSHRKRRSQRNTVKGTLFLCPKININFLGIFRNVCINSGGSLQQYDRKFYWALSSSVFWSLLSFFSFFLEGCLLFPCSVAS